MNNFGTSGGSSLEIFEFKLRQEVQVWAQHTSLNKFKPVFENFELQPNTKLEGRNFLEKQKTNYIGFVFCKETNLKYSFCCRCCESATTLKLLRFQFWKKDKLF